MQKLVQEQKRNGGAETVERALFNLQGHLLYGLQEAWGNRFCQSSQMNKNSLIVVALYKIKQHILNSKVNLFCP